MRRRFRFRTLLLSVVVLMALGALGYAVWGPHSDSEAAKRLVASYDKLSGGGKSGVSALASEIGEPAAGEHPLMPLLRWARAERSKIAAIKDYSATMIKRELVGDKLLDPQYAFVKIRQQPMSVYMRFLAPPEIRNREVIYVAGKNGGKLIAHTTGVQHHLLGAIALDPSGPIAMADNRHPITEIGILWLLDRLLEVGEQDAKRGDCQVRTTTGTVDHHPCTCIEVEHPQRDANFLYYRAKVYLDDALRMPVRFEAYSWPEGSGEAPLLEEYTYTDLKLNCGFTDRDFDPENPAYAFSRTATPENLDKRPDAPGGNKKP